MSDWFYVKEGKQLGPITEEELRNRIKNSQISEDSKIWKEELPDWITAKERFDINNPSAEGITPDNEGLSEIKTYFPVSIFACIVCLLNPFAAFALVYSLQTKNALNDKRLDDAQKKSTQCKKMLFITFILSIMAYISCFLFYILIPTR